MEAMLFESRDATKEIDNMRPPNRWLHLATKGSASGSSAERERNESEARRVAAKRVTLSFFTFYVVSHVELDSLLCTHALTITKS